MEKMRARSRERAVPSFDNDKRCTQNLSSAAPMQQRLCVCATREKRTLYGAL